MISTASAVIAVGGLIAEPPDEEWTYVLLGALASAVASALLLATAAVTRQRSLFPLEMRAGHFIRQLREWESDVQAVDDPQGWKWMEGQLERARADFEGLVKAGEYRQAARLYDAIDEASRMLAFRGPRKPRP